MQMINPGKREMQLPVFKYHPDPIDTGTFVTSEAECAVCNQKTGYVYEGPLYSLEADEDDESQASVCLWCIANGNAATKLNVQYS